MAKSPAADDRAPAPLLVGVTGKLDLKGADAAVRAALDLAFERLDARCPGTPKILLSSLARGADTLAAEAALARANWSVVAPLPFSAALYLEDFDQAAGARFQALLAEPRVKVIVLDPLRQTERDEPFAEADLGRSEPSNPVRTDHYEQAGLFIAERAALLIAVMEADEAPGKVGGAARIVRHRLDGELDAGAASIARRSDVLTEPERLMDRRTGPVWIVDLAGLARAPDAPAKSLLAWNPGQTAPAVLGETPATRRSLRLADSLETLNQHIAKIDRQAWSDLERRAGPQRGDAASGLRRIRAALSVVQGQMVRRVRRSIWLLAVLSCAAIFSFEIYVDLTFYDWSRWFSIVYSGLVATAILIYGYASRQRWQRLAEDYRAAAEALRVQLVWWASGLLARDDRVGRFYLRAAFDSLRQLRALVDHLIDAAELTLGPPPTEATAAETWVEEQIEFFDQRIVDRRRGLAIVEGASWFLFGASLGVGACLALMQVRGELTLALMSPTHWRGAVQLAVLLAGAMAVGGLLLISTRGGRAGEGEAGAIATPAVWIMGLAGGLVLTFTLCDLAAMASGATPNDLRTALTLDWAKDLVAIAVILPAAMAGALRYVADKSSWAAELSGYEHVRNHFRRGRLALAAEGPAGPERRQIVLELGEEALSENEAWLRSHRERPLEPIVGG